MLLLYRCDFLPPPPEPPDLHSTMLLLYPQRGSGRIPGDLIYIPLCFYFIGICVWLSGTCCRFTFHYASTLSHPARWLRKKWLYLHSTMLLLYPAPLFPFYFLQYRYTFCLPPFFIEQISKIFLLPLYKIWISLDISRFVYPMAIFLYLRSTIIRSCLSYHHPLPKIP